MVYHTKIRNARTVEEQYQKLRQSGERPEKWGIKKVGGIYAVIVAGQVEYLVPSRKIVWRGSKYGWSRYDARKRGKQQR